MLMITWNCQGVGRPLKVSNIRVLIKVHHPALIFSNGNQEHKRKTWAHSKKQVWIILSMLTRVVWLFGGITLYSYMSILVTLILSHPLFSIINLVFGTKIFVYGLTLAVSRQALWHRSSMILNATNKSNVIVRDLNIVGETTDKVGGIIISLTIFKSCKVLFILAILLKSPSKFELYLDKQKARFWKYQGEN